MSGWQQPYPPPPASAQSLAKAPGLLRMVAWLPLAVGLCCLAVSAWQFLDTRAFLARAERTEGTVVRLVPVQNRDGNGVTYAPVFRLSGPDGRSVEVTGSSSANPPAWQAGQAVTLLRDPTDPARVHPDGAFSIWLMTSVFGLLGLAGLASFAALRFASGRMAADLARR